MATSGVDALTLDPWHEPGIPLEEQYRSWKQRIKAPYDKHEVDQQQQTTINWLHPADQSVLETTEDFDHLYRYSELLDYLLGKDPNTIVQGKTEIFPGRPTSEHHNHPEVRLLRHYEKNRALPLSRIHTLTCCAASSRPTTSTRSTAPKSATGGPESCTPRSARSRRSTSPSMSPCSTRPRRCSGATSSTS